MTHEEFMGLQVGDILDYKWVKYEITETYNNGIGIETNGIKVNLMPGEPPLKFKTLIFRRRNGVWVFSCSDPDLNTFDINDLNILSKKSSEENSIEYFEKKIEETKTELVRLETALKGLEDSKTQKLLMQLVPEKLYSFVYRTIKCNDEYSVTVVVGEYEGIDSINGNIKLVRMRDELRFDIGRISIIDIKPATYFDSLRTQFKEMIITHERNMKELYK